MAIELIDIHEVSRVTSLKISTIQHWLKRRRMPQPIKLAKNVSRWRREEIEEWISRGCPDLSNPRSAEAVPETVPVAP